VKLTVKELSQIDHILINGPSASLHNLGHPHAARRGRRIKGGIELLKTYMKTKKIVVAVEKNKPEAIAKCATSSPGWTA
jgi:Na+-translocating ferredoxin:NAD+ oxidoreductase RnfC subunit